MPYFGNYQPNPWQGGWNAGTFSYDQMMNNMTMQMEAMKNGMYGAQGTSRRNALNKKNGKQKASHSDDEEEESGIKA